MYGWNGIFVPKVRKHRLDTGDIKNHIELKGRYVDERRNVCVARIAFIDDDDQEYLFEFGWFESEEVLTDWKVLDEVARQLQ